MRTTNAAIRIAAGTYPVGDTDERMTARQTAERHVARSIAEQRSRNGGRLPPCPAAIPGGWVGHIERAICSITYQFLAPAELGQIHAKHLADADR